MIGFHEASFSPFGGRRYGRSDPPRTFRPRACSDLCRHRRLTVLPELFKLLEDQRKKNPEIYPLSAFQSSSGGGINSRRASRRRDAQYLALCGNREALSRIDHGHRQSSQHPARRKGACQRSNQWEAPKTGRKIDRLLRRRVRSTTFACQSPGRFCRRHFAKR